MTADYPLSDIRVLDLSRVLAGPFAGRMLADLGADVIKVEPPDRDVTRNWGRKVGPVSGYYNQQNAGKRNLCVDLRKEEGKQIILDLVRNVDLVIENFRPGVMDRLGIGWDVIHATNPAVIMLSISGFGQAGPESQRAAYAPIIHAETGAIQRQSDKANSTPAEMCMSFADTNAGLHGLVGLLAALHQKQRTGTGQHIDICMVDAMLATDDHTHYYLDDAKVIGNGASEVWQTQSGPIIIAGDFRHIWRMMNEVLGVDDPTPEGAPLEDKISLRRQKAADYLASFETREALIGALDRANLAWGDVQTTTTCLGTSPTLRHRGSIVEIDDRAGGTRPVFQSPYRFSGANSGVRSGAPHLGEHNEQVLSDLLGYPAEKLQRLKDAGVTLAENQR
ncbi:MAG: CoA transferase [Pseudomonadales bacterium]|nr:CoA transferase [Pseudomonadales bacterium]